MNHMHVWISYIRISNKDARPFMCLKKTNSSPGKSPFETMTKPYMTSTNNQLATILQSKINEKALTLIIVNSSFNN